MHFELTNYYIILNKPIEINLRTLNSGPWNSREAGIGSQVCHTIYQKLGETNKNSEIDNFWLPQKLKTHKFLPFTPKTSGFILTWNFAPFFGVKSL